MALSERTRSVRAVRDTPVADYSAPGINTTRRVAYRPLIAASAFLLALPVSDVKQTLWRCGQLWPYVRMGSFGTRLHRDCNADSGVERHHLNIRRDCNADRSRKTSSHNTKGLQCRPWCRKTSSHYTKYTLYLSHLLISIALSTVS